MFSSRISTKQLAEMLRRLAISLEAGIDIRQVLTSEARRSSPAVRQQLEAIGAAVNGGSSLTDAVRETGNFFPPLTRELISVGEQTGHLPEVLRQLAAHYDEQIALRRIFVGTITWPMLQLGFALFVVGFLIWVSGLIGRITNNRNHPVDILGLGLIGEKGLLVYLLFLFVVGVGLFIVYRAVVAGKVWTDPIQRLVLRLPKVGTALRTMAMARFAWTLHLTMATALDVKRALSMALAATHNAEYISHNKTIQAAIERGESIHEALSETRVFPIELLNAVHVGEESGRLAESLAVVARQQLDEARHALAILTRVAGYIVWFLVAALIVTLIFRLAGLYFGTLNQLLK